jgi:hypothetical protein
MSHVDKRERAERHSATLLHLSSSTKQAPRSSDDETRNSLQQSSECLEKREKYIGSSI